MTTQSDIDHKSKTPLLPFDSTDIDCCGIRLRPAQFSRMLGCTKQAVSNWIRDGKLTLGADGRLDPRKAVAQLLRTSNPARIRAMVLKPLMHDIGTYQQRIVELEDSLTVALDDAEYHSAAAAEFLALIDRIRNRLIEEWETLRAQPSSLAVAAFCAWLDYASENAQCSESNIRDFLLAGGTSDAGAPVSEVKGEGDSTS